MKARFTTIDLMASLHEIRTHIGLRVNNVYDIDNKTYLVRLMKPDFKCTLLIESGIRMYLTDFDYPKNITPSSFSMKLRKHINKKRLESVEQLGIDRIVDLQFGSGECACHVIIELYDRGNVILTDFEYVILNVLRPRTDKENTDVKFRVHEKYPLHLAKQTEQSPLSIDQIDCILRAAQPKDNLRKVLTPKFVFGPALLEHCLLQAGFSLNQSVSKLNLAVDLPKLFDSISNAYKIFDAIKHDRNSCCGVITLKREKRPVDNETIETYIDFQPMLFAQCAKLEFKQFDNFNAAVDEFFSKIESQKIDAKSVQQEKTVLKKLENVRRDHENRLKNLQQAQDVDKKRAELIEHNKELVDRAILVINSALAKQLSWHEIEEMVEEAKERGDRVALAIESLNLGTNHATLKLADPYHVDYDNSNSEQSSASDEEVKRSRPKDHSVLVDIDLGMGAYQNARKYYAHKKQSAFKERKTIQASESALKSAEHKTQELLKQVQTNRRINKSRKPFWFEKFFWFLSNDGILVVGGRDAQQNEILVKRYLKPGDAYVHADIRGASSVVVKGQRSVSESASKEIPPRTLLEAGTMAICHSAAWDAKVVTSAWWVTAEQVSKTAPAGEYLTTGSFMIRGKKNYLPPCQLIMGFGIMFKLDDESAAKRAQAKKLTPSLDTNLPDSTIDQEQEDFEEVEIQLDEHGQEEDEAALHDAEVEPTDFPDVAVDLKHLNLSPADQVANDEEYSVINIGPRAPVPKAKQPKKGASADAKLKKPEISDQIPPVNKSNQAKRGQKSKLKKIKEKYKDQDDEERELRLRLLGSTKKFDVNLSEQQHGPKFDNKNSKSKKTKFDDVISEKLTDNAQCNEETQNNVTALDRAEMQPDDFRHKIDPLDRVKGRQEADEENSTDQVKGQQEADDEISDDEPVDEKSAQHELTLDFSSLLTGSPNSDDPDEILLFSVPVCAPYSVMVNWKFKVKLTPGTGKKGKATKTALEVFLRDKSTNQREKELLKALAEQDLSRNFPGKVKLSAPQLQRVKKKH